MSELQLAFHENVSHMKNLAPIGTRNTSMVRGNGQVGFPLQIVFRLAPSKYRIFSCSRSFVKIPHTPIPGIVRDKCHDTLLNKKAQYVFLNILEIFSNL